MGSHIVSTLKAHDL